MNELNNQKVTFEESKVQEEQVLNEKENQIKVLALWFQQLLGHSFIFNGNSNTVKAFIAVVSFVTSILEDTQVCDMCANTPCLSPLGFQPGIYQEMKTENDFYLFLLTSVTVG